MQIGRPYSKHPKSHLFHVRILRLIKLHTLPLSAIGRREFYRVTVPIIPIKLNHCSQGRDIGINAKLSRYHVLLFMRNAQGVKHFIAFPLIRIWRKALLFCIHRYQQFSPVWVFISAEKGTIGYIAATATRRRPTEYFTACFANMLSLISPLPEIRMGETAKIVFSLNNALARAVELFTAELTRDLFSCTPGGSFSGTRTTRRTILSSWFQASCDGLLTTRADDCSYFIGILH